jgi:hypothetical protein
MARSILVLVAAAGVVGALGAAAQQPEKHEQHEHAAAPHAALPAFEKMKSLVGTWKGKASHGESEVFDASVTYRLTGGGSALVETLFPGTPHEMVTVYTRDGDSILLTHYCTMGNQPRMRCTPTADLSTLKFDFVDGGNMTSVNDPHMHSLVMTFDGPDKLGESWSMYEDGKPTSKAKFAMERVKDDAHHEDHAK